MSTTPVSEQCESCGGTSEVPRHGLLVCATCLHNKAEVRLMVTIPVVLKEAECWMFPQVSQSYSR